MFDGITNLKSVELKLLDSNRKKLVLAVLYSQCKTQKMILIETSSNYMFHHTFIFGNMTSLGSLRNCLHLVFKRLCCKCVSPCCTQLGVLMSMSQIQNRASVPSSPSQATTLAIQVVQVCFDTSLCCRDTWRDQRLQQSMVLICQHILFYLVANSIFTSFKFAEVI